jgi:RNA-directed DNA polymerase
MRGAAVASRQDPCRVLQGRHEAWLVRTHLVHVPGVQVSRAEGQDEARNYFFGFNPAVSDEAAKRIRAQIRSWRLHLRSGWTLKELAREINAVVRGWISYYGRYYPSALVRSLNRINDYLVRWIVQKYKRYRGKWKRAREALRKAERLYPRLFAHWKLVKP